MQRRRARYQLNSERLEQRELLALTPLQLSSSELSVSAQEVATGDEGVFFVAEQAVSNELWWSDGTPGGARLLTASVSSNLGSPLHLAATETVAFFPAFTNATGNELGVSDGTVEGTTVIDISPGQPSSSLSELTVANGRAIFLGPSPSPGEQSFWISDASQAGTGLIEGSLSSVDAWRGVDDLFWFVTPDATNPSQLWTWNGTAESEADLIGQLPIGATLSDIHNIEPTETGYVFTYEDELWHTDLTPGGTTQRIKQFATISSDEFALTNGEIFFVASDDTAVTPVEDRIGSELWKSDGTSDGTMLVADIRTGPESSGIRSLAAAGGAVVFFADDGNGSQLWTSDGTADGTSALLELTSGFRGSSQTYRDVAYFSEASGLWRSDGTTEGTYEVIDGQVSSNITDSPFVVMRPGQLWGLVPSHVINSIEFPEIAVVGEPFAVTADVTNNLGDELTFEWDFGDGSPSTTAIDDPSATHTFDTVGRFDISVTVANEVEATESFGATVAVIDSSPTLIYDTSTGGISIESPNALQSFTIRSASGLFTGEPASLDGGSIIDRDDLITRFDPTGFTSVELGPVAAAGLTEQQLLADLSIGASTADVPNVNDAKIVWTDNSELILIYDSATGELQSRARDRLTTLEIQSNDEVFKGVHPAVITAEFDIYRPDKLFRLTPDGAELVVNYGPSVQPGLSAEYLALDWGVTGSVKRPDDARIGSYAVVDAHRVGQLLDQPPIPSIMNASIVEGEGVLLDASGTIDSDTDVAALSFSWIINGTEVVDATASVLDIDWDELSQQYLSPERDGQFDVVVRVGDGTSTESATGLLEVTNIPPTIGSIDFVESGLVGESIAFTASAEDVGGDALVFDWDFGDGDVAAGSEATHAYSGPGDYTVRLSVFDGTETTETTGQISIRANTAPNADDDTADLTASDIADLTDLLLANDADPDGDQVTIVGADAISLQGAVVTVSEGRLSYDPTGAATIQSLPQGVVVFDRFQYSIEDEFGGVATATVSIELTAVNEPPKAIDDEFTFMENDERFNLTQILLSNDSDLDAGDVLRIASINSEVTIGNVELDGGNVFYTPGPGFDYLEVDAITNDEFTYEIRDLSGAAATATVTLTIVGESDERGDFDGNGVVEGGDIDSLCNAINQGGFNPVFDLNDSGSVSLADLDVLVGDVLGTSYGDINLDGVFNSTDLVLGFAAGEYEDLIEDNSRWATGDWNCDREFDTSDLIRAFSQGAYSADAVARHPVAAAVVNRVQAESHEDYVDNRDRNINDLLDFNRLRDHKRTLELLAIDNIFQAPQSKHNTSSSSHVEAREPLSLLQQSEIERRLR